MEFESRKVQPHRVIYPRQVILVTSISNEGKANIITLAWSSFISIKPPIMAICIANKGRYSKKLIEETYEFIINVPTAEIAKEVYFCGSNSGKLINKFIETGLTPVPAKKVKPPIIGECVGFMECRVIKSVMIGDHTVYFGEILDDYVKAEFTTKDGYDLKKVKLLYHLGGNKFTTNAEEKIIIKI
ncbi:MAG: flavin reductase family protein [Candidatus Lokiarchaeota archaeon]|nr:flavin reductase family protein [Candidatus Lokiarchaeota archaeon]